MRVLLTGAGGYLGQHLIRERPDSVDLTAAWHQNNPPALSAAANTLHLNLTDFSPVQLDKYRPDIIIHAAAITNVDTCEKHPELARAVNSEATRKLAEWSAANGTRFIFVSTDQIFAGNRSFYGEDDQPDPINSYGRSKAEAEAHVLNIADDALVVRSALIYGRSLPDRPSFTTGMIGHLHRGKPINLFTDQFRTPVYVKDLANAIWQIALSDNQGILHLGGAQRVSRFQMGEILCSQAQLDRRLLNPVQMKDVALAAPRPADVSLSIGRAESILKSPLRSFEDGIRDVLGLID